MKRQFLILFTFLLPLISLNAQDTKSAREFQLGISDESQFERLMTIVPGVGSSARELLQQQSIKTYLMPTRKVGVRGYESSYILAACLEFYVNLEKNYKENLSPDYISLSLKNTGKRINTKDALGLLAKDGTVSAAILPYDANELTAGVYSTKKYNIQNYLHIFRAESRKRQKIFEVRKALMKGNPVIIEMSCDESIKDFQGKKFIEGPTSGTQSYPMLIVGFDEIQQAFEIHSPWGREWGRDGYAWIKYDDFSRLTTNGFVMIPQRSYL